MEGKVLIVDDEEEILKSLRSYLTLEGFDVETAQDPFVALEMVRDGQYPVILCDIMMPGMGGLELLQEILQVRPLTNVTMMTAFTSMEKVVACLGHGARDYLVKPFKDLDMVGTCVRESCERIERWRESIAIH